MTEQEALEALADDFDQALNLGAMAERMIMGFSTGPRAAVMGACAAMLALSYRGRNEGISDEELMQGNHNLIDEIWKLLNPSFKEASAELLAEKKSC